MAAMLEVDAGINIGKGKGRGGKHSQQLDKIPPEGGYLCDKGKGGNRGKASGKGRSRRDWRTTSWTGSSESDSVWPELLRRYPRPPERFLPRVDGTRTPPSARRRGILKSLCLKDARPPPGEIFGMAYRCGEAAWLAQHLGYCSMQNGDAESKFICESMPWLRSMECFQSEFGAVGDSACLQLPFPQDHVYFADTRESFDAALEVLQGLRVIGIDVQTDSMAYPDRAKRPMLIQLATATKRVVVLDMLTMSAEDSLFDDVSNFLARLLQDPMVWLVGCAVEEHLELISSVLITPVERECHMLDAGQLFATTAQPEPPTQLKLCSLVTAGQLSLAKRCQYSDWAARPLYLEQLHYAALDALFPLAAAALGLKLPRPTEDTPGNKLLPLPQEVVQHLAVAPEIAAEFQAAWAATVDWLRPQALRSRASSASSASKKGSAAGGSEV
jgi:hypothetical protein